MSSIFFIFANLLMQKLKKMKWIQFLKKLFKFFKTSCLYFYCRNKCKEIDFFQYEKLSKANIPLPFSLTPTFLYGNYKAVAKLKGHSFNFWNEYLEHGITFYQTIESVAGLGYANRKIVRKIYTFSEHRKQIILNYLSQNNLKKEVIAVGPYIKGASHFYSMNELESIKNKYGKILLVFSVHSNRYTKLQFNQIDFINAIKKASSYFDNVFICMYFNDVLENKSFVAQCEKQNFIIVCSGHSGDPKFLSRQKDLIYLSDMVMTNALGTYMGYAICMNKPLYFFNQETDYQLIENIQFLSEIIKKGEQNIAQFKMEYLRLFGNFSFNITEEQISFIKKYWGEWKN
jgi:hypothetical protein